MDELMQHLVDTVTDAGGHMPFPEMMAKVPAEQRSRVNTAMDELKRQNRLLAIIRLVNRKPVHTVYLPGALDLSPVTTE